MAESDFPQAGGASPREGEPCPAPVEPQPAGREQPNLDHRFNDDLLCDPKDQAVARLRFPEVFHVLDHPELRHQFGRYNAMADRAKRRVHAIGLTAVALATLALLSSAITPVLTAVHQVTDLGPAAAKVVSWMESASVFAEIAGLVGAAIAIGGLWIAGWKKQWLQGRLMTERLRQWHFQLLIHRGKEIEESCNPADASAKEAFTTARAQWFASFLHEHEGTLDSVLQELIEAPESCYTALHEPHSAYPRGSKALGTVFEAYKALRLKHQVYYAAHKLQKTTIESLLKPHAWPITVLKNRLMAVTSFCLISALLVSAFIVVAHFMDWTIAHSVALPSVILCLLVLNAAIRAVQDGLAVREETQRYADYSGEIRYLLTRFEALHDAQERLRLMQDMERTVVEELKSFLRAHSEARFIV